MTRAPEQEIAYRPAEGGDAGFLLEMLERAFDWRDDPAFDRALMREPHVAHYVTPWPRGHDFGVVADRPGVDGPRPVGAAWVRHLTGADRGYGYVGDDVPELTMAVAREHRGQGIGRGLLERLVRTAEQVGLPGLSLSVEDGNAARALYERLGFTVVGREGNSDTLALALRPPGPRPSSPAG